MVDTASLSKDELCPRILGIAGRRGVNFLVRSRVARAGTPAENCEHRWENQKVSNECQSKTDAEQHAEELEREDLTEHDDRGPENHDDGRRNHSSAQFDEYINKCFVASCPRLLSSLEIKERMYGVVDGDTETDAEDRRTRQ